MWRSYGKMVQLYMCQVLENIELEYLLLSILGTIK